MEIRKKQKYAIGHPLKDVLEYAVLAALRPDLWNRDGMGVKRSVELGIDKKTLLAREKTEDYALAKQVATRFAAPRVREKTFGDYVFKHLSPEARKTWDELQFWAEHKDRQEHVERIVTGRAPKVRQELFIHALVSVHYDVSQALEMTGLSRSQLQAWIATDLDFAQLIEEIQWHKKNFFEKAMLDLVAERNPVAVIWANKTVNADRGYSEKVRVEHTVQNSGFNFEDLDLDPDTRRKVLEAIRKKQSQLEEQKATPRPALPAPVVDVEEVAAGK